MPDLSNSAWSPTDASNNTASPNGWPAGMAPNGVEPSARMMMGALKRWWNRANAVVTTTGSAGAYVYNPTNASFPTEYVHGEGYRFKANFTSVGSDTLNVNSLGAKPLYKRTAAGQVVVAAGDIVSGDIIEATYDSALDSTAGGFQISFPARAAPTVTKLTSGSGTYNTPAGCTRLEAEAVGGGGGAGASASSGLTAATAGGDTTFGTLTAGGGGAGGGNSGVPGGGGGASGGDFGVSGNPGVRVVNSTTSVGGTGGGSFFGGAGAGAAANAAGAAAATNSGSGGGGAGPSSGQGPGGGGGAGAYVRKRIIGPAASYSYAVGAAGTGGGAGTGNAGGAGSSGLIIVWEYY